ncbi:MAG: MotA/TolQ/ExbB proton channel family protein [Deltaproteobacteria bacterium]|nr:MotA/TolQ/ExbB proton channel family protein [Deltaproteobacteria bacterium]
MPFLVSNVYAASSQFRGNIGAMIIDANPVVKFVLFVLFIFSVISWAIIIYKWVMLSRARQNNQSLLVTLAKGSPLSEMIKETNKIGNCPITILFNDAHEELNRITGKGSSIPLSILNNVESKIAYSRVQQDSQLSVGLGFLASISNASPFIGLFGTVWGIMDSFREIGLMGSANLATVAPGISEALIATAAGLFVAIPAVLFYNYFNGTLENIATQMEAFQIDFMNWLRREVVHVSK